MTGGDADAKSDPGEPPDADGDAAVSDGGVQSVRRAAALLRALARAPAEGARLKDLAETLGFERTTTHRLLWTLIPEHLVEQDASTKRYRLGLDFFSLAVTASNRYDVQHVAHASVTRLADMLGDCVFFSLRSGDDCICVDAHAGLYPLRTLPTDIGARHPLGVSATGIAFLAPLPDIEIQEILQHNAPRLERFVGCSPSDIASAIGRFREVGFAFDSGRAVGDVPSIAVPLPDRRGRPLSVLTVAARPERMPVARRATIAAAVQTEGEQIVNMMWRKSDTTRHRQTWELPTKPPLTRR